MNRVQNERQLAYLLSPTKLLWPTPDATDDPLYGSAGKAVFGESFVSALPVAIFAQNTTMPCAAVSAIADQANPDHPERMTVGRYRVTIVARSSGDRHGSGALAGGHRSSQGKSDGRGLDELLSIVKKTLGRLVESTHGIQGVIDQAGAPRQIVQPDLVAAELEVRVFNGTGEAVYYGVRRALGASGVAGAYTLRWDLPPARFDLRRIIVRRGTVGGGSPATPTAGTGVTVTGGDLGTTAAESGLAAGLYPISIFAAYDETGRGADERFSAAVQTSATVT